MSLRRALFQAGFPLLVAAASCGLFLLCLLGVLVARTLFRRRGPRVGRLLAWNLVLAPVHAFVTVPFVFALLIAGAGTRGDERAYAGPRLDARGDWLVQDRATLRAEHTQGKDAPSTAEALPPIALETRDGVTLRAFLVPPRAEPRAAVVMAHGLFRNAMELEPPAAMLRDLGALVLLVELRNHGGSGRGRTGFGAAEAEDVRAAAEWLRARPEAKDLPLVLFGVSMGSAACALAAPEVEGLAAVVLDSPFEDAHQVFDRLMGNLPLPSFTRTPLRFALELLTTDLDAVRPAASLATLRIPILVIAGGEDERCPPESVKRLFAALPHHPDSALWIEPGSDHGKVWLDAPQEYRARLANLLEAITR